METNVHNAFRASQKSVHQPPDVRVRRSWQPAVLTYAFRPMFLAAGSWAIVAIAIWLAMFLGYLRLPTRFDPLTWHIHEMLFGFVMASVAGFLLTAIPNWTGRLPVRGYPRTADAPRLPLRTNRHFCEFSPPIPSASPDVSCSTREKSQPRNGEQHVVRYAQHAT